MLALFKMKRRSPQLALGLKPRFGWGGARKGAGRKPTGTAGVPHRARERVLSRHPSHVTLRVLRGLPSLRTQRCFARVRQAMVQGCDRSGFRLIHFSVQTNHLHLIVEAADEVALSRGIKGLEVRIARRLNALIRRKGRFFSDRYHARALTTPREVRAAIAYVLLNSRKHAHQSGKKLSSDRADPLSSAIYFDGWRDPITCIAHREDPSPVTKAETWLLREGWKRHGLISVSEIPACA